MTLNRGVLTVVRYRAMSNPVLFPVLRHMQSRLCLSVFHGQARGHATLKRLGLSASVSSADILFTRAEPHCHQMRNFTSAGSLHRGLLTRAGSSGHGLLTKAGSPGHGLLTSRMEDAACLQTLNTPLGHPRCFHTTPQRYIPPLFWVLIKPVAKLGAILSGRYNLWISISSIWYRPLVIELCQFVEAPLIK